MKPFAIWLSAVVVLFGGYALVASSLRETTQVFVFVDSSNPMAPVWGDVQRRLDDIDDRGDAEFALAHGQSRQDELDHSWQSELTLSGVQPFAPCSFDAIDSSREAAEADERILITTSSSCDTSALVDWDVVFLEP
ncbi:hypothetical protein [Ilumatobacter sp.]|uniref:hypothetical protein n=1 Tax=Ilumatobacter sp. TaxID=1967498 RepID=UPI003C67E066